MATYSHPVLLINKNHSHPEYPNGLTPGNLAVDGSGLVFRPNSDRFPAVVIPYDNLISTYTDVLKGVGYDWDDYRNMGDYLTTVITFGSLFPTQLAYVSLKFKLVDFDKICVVGFGVPLAGRKNWAVDVDAMIWSHKRHLRQERYR